MLNLSAACRSKDLRYTLIKTALVALLAIANPRAAEPPSTSSGRSEPAERDVRLIAAVKAGDRAAVTSLLRQRINVNTPEPDGTTALHWAVRQDDLQLTDQLIRAGADVKTANRYGITALYLASV